MWDVRYATMATMRLEEQRAGAQDQRQAEEVVDVRPGRLRRWVGAALVRAGERLAPPPVPSRPAPAGQ